MKVLIVSSASRGVQRISGVVLYLVLGLVLVAGVFLGGGAWALWVEHQESQSVGLPVAGGNPTLGHRFTAGRQGTVKFVFA